MSTGGGIPTRLDIHCIWSTFFSSVALSKGSKAREIQGQRSRELGTSVASAADVGVSLHAKRSAGFFREEPYG